jgi:hypothetical protein
MVFDGRYGEDLMESTVKSWFYFSVSPEELKSTWLKE